MDLDKKLAHEELEIKNIEKQLKRLKTPKFDETTKKCEDLERNLLQHKKFLEETKTDKRNDILREHMTRELVDAFCPDHDRTSCSDKNHCNDDRCSRCYLLEALEIGLWDCTRINFYVDRE